MIDFEVPVEVEELRERVRAFVADPAGMSFGTGTIIETKNTNWIGA